MLDNLLEIEIAYKLLQESDENANSKDPIDAHYEKLKTDITVLDRESDEFQLLEKYVKNTHAATHTMYTLEVEEVGCVPLLPVMSLIQISTSNSVFLL